MDSIKNLENLLKNITKIQIKKTQKELMEGEKRWKK